MGECSIAIVCKFIYNLKAEQNVIEFIGNIISGSKKYGKHKIYI